MDGMYLTSKNINSLNGIISELNSMEDDREKERFLGEHIEDTALFLEILRKVNKKKIPVGYGKIQKQERENVEVKLYKEEDIYAILCEKDDAEIVKDYSLNELKQMYASIYEKRPASKYTKERIISVLRNRMHSMKRAEAFASLAAERDKKKENYVK